MNFHSAEFNHTDNLNDCSGNYRSFQSLEGIVTADMRHQRERQRSGAADEASADDRPSAEQGARQSRGQNAVASVSPLIVISQGRTLIIAADAERAVACGRLLCDQGLTCTVLVTKNAPPGSPAPGHAGLRFLEVNTVSVAGAFGGFSATVTVKGEQKGLTEWFDDEAALFDLVLDLQSSPSFAGSLLPLGYYAPGPDPLNLQEVLVELPEMRGRFEKPRFIAFVNNHCIHGRSRTRDCRRCLEVCPFGAIQSVDRHISFDHSLCRGCGGCALVCPTDAIHTIHPSPEELLEKLQDGLETLPAGVDFPPLVVISDTETAGGNSRSDGEERKHNRRLDFPVEQIGFVGLEMLLTALAYGAGTVAVICSERNPPAIRTAVERQAQMAVAVLKGLGMPPDRIRFAIGLARDRDSEKAAFPATGPDARSAPPPLPPAHFSPRNDKRTLVRLATQHLYDRSGAQQPLLPLPPGSPFGTVAVDAARCTLCMACVTACPFGALSAGVELPRLEFHESACRQCGLCEETCPERAIRLLPRMLCDPRAVEAPAVLREVEPFRCIECGVPFASPAIIARMEEKLAGHWMYRDDRQLRRLRLCGTCRARDTLASQDVKSWSR